MFTKAFNAIFMTRPFWNEVNVPQSLVLKIYKEYLGTKNMIITSRAESIKYISPIVNRLQREILDWIKSTNTNQVIKDLYQIFDKCFRLYITEKEARKQLVDLNISDDDKSYQLYLRNSTLPEMIGRIKALRKSISDYQLEITSNSKAIRAKKQSCFEDDA